MGTMEKEIQKWKRANGYKDEKTKTTAPKKKKRKQRNNGEQMNQRDIEELMGMRQPVFERRRGALRHR
ncbi:hypothetical protein [Priestia flexa]|uniref:hypothetical protein n=1 Tax=Priestia flexa TaxID=86664 RepID=UPI003D071965